MDYCKWFCVEWIDKNKWTYKSSCGEVKDVSKNSKFFKFLHSDSDLNKCPNCNKVITVGELIR